MLVQPSVEALEFGTLCFADVFEQKYAAEQHGKGERHDAAECYAPAVGVDDRAAKHGANGGAG